MDLLWENPNPTVNFNAQTLPIKTDYTFYVIRAFVNIYYGNTHVHNNIIINSPEDNMISASVFEANVGRIAYRKVKMMSTGLHIGDAVATFESGNQACIPLKVWGIK